MRINSFHPAAWTMAAVASGFAGSAQAAPTRHSLDDTGLTTCLDTTTWQPTACAGTGQDGEFGRDVTHPRHRDGLAGFSFVKVCNSGKMAGEGGCSPSAVQGSGPHDWGCTKDLVTGLTWELRTTDGSIRDANRFFSNYGTNDSGDTGGLVAAMNAQALCGATDWRLPSVTELFSLAVFDPSSDISKWLPDLGFGFDEFWTPEDADGNPAYAWYVETSSQDVNSPETHPNQRSGDTVATAARVVRGPKKLTHLSATDDEVSDAFNHLSWRRCVEGMTWQAPKCIGTPDVLTWSDALAYANEVALSTGVAWRLPDIKELQSISVLSRNPTVDPVLFPQTPATRTWSSTGWGPSQAIFSVDFDYGRATRESGEFDAKFVVRLVRDTR